MRVITHIAPSLKGKSQIDELSQKRAVAQLASALASGASDHTPSSSKKSQQVYVLELQQTRCGYLQFQPPMAVYRGSPLFWVGGPFYLNFRSLNYPTRFLPVRGSVCGGSQKHVKEGRLELEKPLEATVCRSMRYKQFDKGVPRMELNAIAVCPEIHSEQHLVSTTERSHLSGLLHLLACL